MMVEITSFPVRHGLSASYKNGCRCPACTEAQTVATREVRQRQREARVEIERRLAARLRSALYHEEVWAKPPRSISQSVWENEMRRTIRRLERGNAQVKRALAASLGLAESHSGAVTGAA